MGTVMSFIKGGPMYDQVVTILSSTLYDKFLDTKTQTLDEFHIAVLEIFNTINSGLPGKHYDAPSRFEIERIYNYWVAEKEHEKKKEIFKNFMAVNVKPYKIDKATVMTGVLTPPVAMAAKRAGENVPQLRMIKAIPDVLFVPSATVLALISVKIYRRVITGSAES